MKRLLLMAMLLIGGLALSQTRTYKAQYYLWSFTYGLDVKDTLHVDVLKFDDGSMLISAPGPGGGGGITTTQLDSAVQYAIAYAAANDQVNDGDSDSTNEIQGLPGVLAVQDTVGNAKIYSTGQFDLESFFQTVIKGGFGLQLISPNGNISMSAPNGIDVANRLNIQDRIRLSDGYEIIDQNDILQGAFEVPFPPHDAFTSTNVYDALDEVLALAVQYDNTYKQDILISGSNIKTINGISLLGSGNINITGGAGEVTQAQLDSMSQALLNIIAQHGLQAVLDSRDSATGNINLEGWVNIDNGGIVVDQGSIYLTEGLENRYHTTADGMGLQWMTNRDGIDTNSYIINAKAATFFQHPSNPHPIVFRGSAGAGAGLYLLKLVPDSGITGYYAGVPKFKTTPGGIEVFGDVVADNILKADTLSINANRQFLSSDKNKTLINRQAVTRTMTLTTGLSWDNYPVNLFAAGGGNVVVNAGSALMIGVGGDTLTTATVCYAATLYPIGPDTYFLLNGSCGSEGSGGIDSVATDNTLIGNGSTGSPLGLPEAIPGKRIFDDLVASGQTEITAPGNTDENQNGNFRFRISATGALVVEKRVSGVWQECTSFNY